MDDVRRAVSMDAKAAGNLIYVVGLTRNELGGSHFHLVRGVQGGEAPIVDTVLGNRIFAGIHQAINDGLLRSCHDCSEGGIGVAAAEMAFAGGLGMQISLDVVPQTGGLRDHELLFAESNSRFVVEVDPDKAAGFELAMQDVPFGRIGQVTPEPDFRVIGSHGRVVVKAAISQLKEAWQSTLAW